MSYLNQISDELLLIFSSPQQDGYMDRPQPPSRKRSHDVFNIIGADQYADQNKPSKKKTMMVVHREVERQRRKETANLYSTLRSLLPCEYLKGKRSVSDHMNEAANYIKHQQKKIQELVDKRDELQMLQKESSVTVIVQDFLAEVEVIITSSVEDDHLLPLSKVLGELVNQRLILLSCTSNRVNGIKIHTIRSEVINRDAFHVSSLQRKLTDLCLIQMKTCDGIKKKE